MNKPATSRVQNVRTPGSPAPAEATEVQDTPELRAQMKAEADALEESLIRSGDTVALDDVVQPAAPGPQVAPDIQALIAEGIRQGVAQALATQRNATTVGTPRKELPDQSEVDAFSIKTEVLTKQGYVVPHQYPQPAGMPPALR